MTSTLMTFRQTLGSDFGNTTILMNSVLAISRRNLHAQGAGKIWFTMVESCLCLVAEMTTMINSTILGNSIFLQKLGTV